MTNPGVYILKHPTGIFYIGSTGWFENRRDEHNSRLRNNGHHNPVLQEAYNSNSVVEYEFFSTANREAAYTLEKQMILANASKPELLNREHNGFIPVISEQARIRSTQLRTGVSLTSIHREKIAKGLTGKTRSLEAISKTALANGTPVLIDDVVYSSACAAARILGVVQGTVNNRVKSTDPRWVGWVGKLENK